MQHKKLKEIADVFTGARLGRFSKKTSMRSKNKQ